MDRAPDELIELETAVVSDNEPKTRKRLETRLLHFQQFGGTVTVGGRSARIEQGQVNGSRIRFLADLGGGRRAFEGRVDGNSIVPHRTSARWRATRAS